MSEMTHDKKGLQAFQMYVDSLRARGRKVNQQRDGLAFAECPAHEDSGTSLRVMALVGGVNLRCNASCEAEAITEATFDPSNNGSASKRQLEVVRASDIGMRATRWLWEDTHGCWIPMGALVGLGGREGVGKSTVCADLAAKVTRGELPGDLYGIPKGVVIVSTEDDWHATIKPRLVAAGADLERVFQVKAIEPDGLEGILSLPEDMMRLEEVIATHDVALVILDPLLQMVNVKLDTHKDADVRRALGPVVRMAHQAQVSLIGLVHVNKTLEGDLLNRIMASKALAAVPRGFLFCAKHSPVQPPSDDDGEPYSRPAPLGTEFLLGQIKNNLAAKIMDSLVYRMDTVTVGHDAEAGKDIKASHLVMDQFIEQNIEDLVLEQEKAKRAVKSQSGQAKGWLVGYLAGKGEVASDQVIADGDAAGYSRNAIHRARTNLGERIKVTNLNVVPRKTTWQLAESETTRTTGTTGDD